MDAIQRFGEFVIPEPNTGCWLWTSYVDAKGYGIFWYEGSPRKAHRMAVIFDGREIPKGKVIDHICRERSCVNPRHLRIVSYRANTMAAGSIAPANLHRLQTHCKYGHPFDESNTHYRRDEKRKGNRECRACRGWKPLPPASITLSMES